MPSTWLGVSAALKSVKSLCSRLPAWRSLFLCSTSWLSWSFHYSTIPPFIPLNIDTRLGHIHCSSTSVLQSARAPYVPNPSVVMLALHTHEVLAGSLSSTGDVAGGGWGTEMRHCCAHLYQKNRSQRWLFFFSFFLNQQLVIPIRPHKINF